MICFDLQVAHVFKREFSKDQVMKLVYLNNAATTSADPAVFKAMKPYFSKKFGNASEVHSLGREAGKSVEMSRKSIADFLGAGPPEIIFTSCATESINLSHKGLVESLRIATKTKPHIITSSIEHTAVLETCRHLEELRWVSVTYLPVDKNGLVNLADLEKAIKKETALVSIMYVNNEVGTIQPIEKIGCFLQEKNRSRAKSGLSKIYFHTDATQAIGYLNCDVDHLGVDFLSFTGHKIHAPKGIGALYARKGTPLVLQMDGGGQEGGMRGGTENVPLIVGLGKAIGRIKNQELRIKNNTEKLRNQLIQNVLRISGVSLTGHPTKRVSHIASFLVDKAEGEAMVLMLSNEGIIVSSGSACTANNLQPSHVLAAMNVLPEKSHGSIRFSLSKNTTKDEINFAVSKFGEVVGKLRKMTPEIRIAN